MFHNDTVNVIWLITIKFGELLSIIIAAIGPSVEGTSNMLVAVNFNDAAHIKPQILVVNKIVLKDTTIITIITHDVIDGTVSEVSKDNGIIKLHICIILLWLWNMF